PCMRLFPPRPAPAEIPQLLDGALKLVGPEWGVRVGRVGYVKATSTRNVVQLARGARFAMERKYDGEYCQIHVDVTRGRDWIRIFSKSGRDSTKDRAAAHEYVCTILFCYMYYPELIVFLQHHTEGAQRRQPAQATLSGA